MTIEQQHPDVSVQINVRNLLSSFRFAFSNRYTIVTELMQNARRAGASYVGIYYDNKTQNLAVRDDGCGIDDFQKLLTFGESGWDQTTIADENAFGLGFTKCLYSAKRCTVWSKGKRMDFDTANALTQANIPVTQCASEPKNETLICLDGVELPELDKKIHAICCGFPIKVVYNGAEQPRPYAVDQIATIETPIGRAFLNGYADADASTTPHLIFLQGFIVDGRARYPRPFNIVHLDSTQFQARLPDRDALIDGEEQYRRIDAALRETWKAHLLRKKSELPPADFVQQWFDAATSWNLLDLFDDVPVLPGKLFNVITDYPYQHAYGSADYLTALDDVVTREQIQSGELHSVMLDDPNEDNTAHWMYARARNWCVFKCDALGKDHWIRPLIIEMERSPCEVEIEGEEARGELVGHWIWPTVVVAAAYTVRYEGEAVTITDAAISWAGEVIVPAGEVSGRAALQVSNFIDGEDHWHDGAQDHDIDALAELIQRLRATDPVKALESMLGDLDLMRFPVLRGKRFNVTIGIEGENLIELAPQ